MITLRAVAVGIVGAIAAVVAGAAVAVPARAAAGAGLSGTIALDICSASLVRYPTSADSDQALMLTNGHCYEDGFLSSGQVLQNLKSTRSGQLLNAAGEAVGTVRADRVLYATMTGTDVLLYRLTDTFATIKARYGISARTIAKGQPAAGTATTIPSGFWKRIWKCRINGFATTLREDEWTWHDSIRYDPACDIIPGTSGSPVLDATDSVVGINNTRYEGGKPCELNNPCEVDENGNITVLPGQGYGQETYWFITCLDTTNTINLSLVGCLLTKPSLTAAARRGRPWQDQRHFHDRGDFATAGGTVATNADAVTHQVGNIKWTPAQS